VLFLPEFFKKSMSSLFYKVRVKEMIRETEDASTVVFDIPAELKDTFRYLPGQYITIRFIINGEDQRRAYSFCSSPYTDPDPAITVKKVENGIVSSYINDSLKAGDTVELMPPLGKFTVDIQEAARRHYFLFAGGSGITPVMSILGSVLEKEPGSFVTLVYTNRNEKSIIFRDKLKKIQERKGAALTVYYSLDEAFPGFQGHVGRLDTEDCRSLIRSAHREGLSTEYYVCGPTGMMDLVTQALKASGIPEASVHSEYFTAPVSSRPVPELPVQEEEEEGGEFRVWIGYSGREYEITVPPGETILEAAKDQNVDPPYACQMGVCTTCRAKVLEGETRMDEREGLSDAEIAEGYILTCQAHPVSKKVRLVYE
jgi:ring-1,2-phenylacetyl-CoA epoxidase subunit PaaE